VKGTFDEIKQAVLRLLGDIAPEADLTALKPDVSFREQMDIDSMDFLNFVIALHKELRVEIPEADYPKLATLNGCVAYVMAARKEQPQAWAPLPRPEP
jgi:acyl carrier protein